MDTTPEKRFLLAANALYLGHMNYLFYIESLDLDNRRENAREDHEDNSSFQRLRDGISWDGLLDDRIEPPFQDREARAERDKRLKDLIASPADIARVVMSEELGSRLVEPPPTVPAWLNATLSSTLNSAPRSSTWR